MLVWSLVLGSFVVLGLVGVNFENSTVCFTVIFLALSEEGFSSFVWVSLSD
ncbi:hypothetical protein HMPREF1531_02312 [Propionibacterium sp. oral taxon 192 str. F0372]|nr:hypothetical protein HMPREF1531_02312 [Propionibacterium sp. oral taxon 192 str. F0372]